MAINPDLYESTHDKTTRFRGLDLRVGASAGLLPALPLRVRSVDRRWELVAHALDRPAQIGGLASAPWASLSNLRLSDRGSSVRLTGVAEPGGRGFEITAVNPLGRWSDLRWLGPANQASAPRDGLVQDVDPEGLGVVIWHDFARQFLDGPWVGSEWPATAWRRDEAAGLLRPAGRLDRSASRFVGLEITHREFAVATNVRLPDVGSAGGGLELHVAGLPRRVGAARGVAGTVSILGTAGAIGVLPASTTEVELAVTCGPTSFGLEVISAGKRVLTRKANRSSGPVSAAGMYADGGGAPVGFAWFEYRGSRCAVANRAGGRG